MKQPGSAPWQCYLQVLTTSGTTRWREYRTAGIILRGQCMLFFLSNMFSRWLAMLLTKWKQANAIIIILIRCHKMEITIPFKLNSKAKNIRKISRTCRRDDQEGKKATENKGYLYTKAGSTSTKRMICHSTRLIRALQKAGNVYYVAPYNFYEAKHKIEYQNKINTRRYWKFSN